MPCVGNIFYDTIFIDIYSQVEDNVDRIQLIFSGVYNSAGKRQELNFLTIPVARDLIVFRSWGWC